MYLSLSGRKSSGGAWIGIVPSGLSTYGADNWGKKRVKLNRQSKEKREREKKKKEKERPIHKGKGIPVNGYLSTLFFSLRLILLAFPVSLLAQFLSLSAIAQQ